MPARTGKFEVITGNGKVAWSKLETKKFPNTKKDMESIYACIEDNL